MVLDKNYKILGLSNHATREEIKRAYHKKAKYFHPDVNAQPLAHENFIAVSKAYHELMNHIRHAKKQTVTQKKHNHQYASAHAQPQYKGSYSQFSKPYNKIFLTSEKLLLWFFIIMGTILLFAPIYSLNIIEDDLPQYIASSVAGVVMGLVFMLFSGFALFSKSKGRFKK